MKNILMLIGLFMLAPGLACAGQPANYQVDPSWLVCGKDADCVAVEDGTCHHAHVVNTGHIDDWTALNADTTRRLQENRISDFCGKPGQVFPVLKDGYAECRNGACAFHDLQNRVNGFTQGK